MLNVQLHEDETAASFCSRTAAVNGISSAKDFANHFNFRFEGIVSGVAKDLDALGDMTGVDTGKLYRNSFRSIEKKTLIRGEWFSDSFLNHRSLRTCSQCVLEDLDTPYRSVYNCYGRIHWTINFIRSCPIHNILLLWTPSLHSAPGDFCSQLRRDLDVMQRTPTCAIEVPPSPLEVYAHGRLRMESSEFSWLDGLPLQAALHFTELLGSAMQYGIDDVRVLTAPEQMAAGAIGFSVTSQGEEAAKACLQELASKSEVLHPRKPDALFKHFMSELRVHQDHIGYLTLLGLIQDVGFGEMSRRFFSKGVQKETN